ncbi:MAG TPA: beta-mannosidase, partial [Treponema sp.]|nr:beta-mannosidase [Treponema sp.]
MSTINLNGSAWTLSASEKKLKISGVQMNIPGDVHSALLRKGIIQNPYWRFNEKDVQWVGKEKWLISRTFDFRKEEGFRTYLTMSMADTYFTLYINGKTAGRGDNYFRLWRFDITNLLKNGKNTISVEFDSAEKRAIADAKKIPYPVPCSQYDMFSPHRNMSRKIQCHSGWDWGPCIMACGIY